LTVNDLAKPTNIGNGITQKVGQLVKCLLIDVAKVPFVRLRVISWIESLLTSGDPLNHTKNHEKHGKLFSFLHRLGTLLCFSV